MNYSQSHLLSSSSGDFMHWELNRLNLICGLVALLGIALFFYCTTKAMHQFPGGYSLTEHFLSELGRSKTASGVDNSSSAGLFNNSIVLLGFTLLPFFWVMPSTVQENTEIMRFTSILSAAGLVGIGLTPYDLYFGLHLLALACWIVPLLVLVVTFTITVDLNHYLKLLVNCLAIFVLLAASAFIFSGQLHLHVISQKLLVVVSAIWFSFVLIIVSIATVRSIPSTKLIADQQARRYLRVIQRGHRRR